MNDWKEMKESELCVSCVKHARNSTARFYACRTLFEEKRNVEWKKKVALEKLGGFSDSQHNSLEISPYFHIDNLYLCSLFMHCWNNNERLSRRSVERTAKTSVINKMCNNNSNKKQQTLNYPTGSFIFKRRHTRWMKGFLFVHSILETNYAYLIRIKYEVVCKHVSE